MKTTNVKIAENCREILNSMKLKELTNWELLTSKKSAETQEIVQGSGQASLKTMNTLYEEFKKFMDWANMLFIVLYF